MFFFTIDSFYVPPTTVVKRDRSMVLEIHTIVVQQKAQNFNLSTRKVLPKISGNISDEIVLFV